MNSKTLSLAGPLAAMAMAPNPVLAQDQVPLDQPEHVLTLDEAQAETSQEVSDVLSFEEQMNEFSKEFTDGLKKLESSEDMEEFLEMLLRFFNFLLLDATFAAILAIDAAILCYAIFRGNNALTLEEKRKLADTLTLAHVFWAVVFGAPTVIGNLGAELDLLDTETILKGVAGLAAVLGIGFAAKITIDQNERDDGDKDGDETEEVKSILEILREKPIYAPAMIAAASPVAVDAGFGTPGKVEEMSMQGMNNVEIALHGGITFALLTVIMRMVVKAASADKGDKTQVSSDEESSSWLSEKTAMLAAAALIGYFGGRSLYEIILELETTEIPIMKFALEPLAIAAAVTASVNQLLARSDKAQGIAERYYGDPADKVIEWMSGDSDDEEDEAPSE